MEVQMDFLSINWFAVVACVLVSMISGTLWYNPKTFFPIWWKGIGKTEQDAPGTSNMNLTIDPALIVCPGCGDGLYG
jgi:hypothetical protein